MYRAGGCWYVYLCYGVHEMLNLVTGPEHWPAAVLIRGVAGAAGPGRLTRALGIDRRLDGSAVAPASGLHLEDRGVRVPRGWVRATPRVGVAFAGPVWAAKPWRFLIEPARVAELAGAVEAGARGRLRPRRAATGRSGEAVERRGPPAFWGGNTVRCGVMRGT